MSEQREKYHEILQDWINRNPRKRGDYPQTDDIIVMGVRF
jgi:hypothetical protein